MTRPRLLLIDDEPQLAAFVANAAQLSGFEPVETGLTSEMFTTPHDSRTEDYITGRFG